MRYGSWQTEIQLSGEDVWERVPTAASNLGHFNTRPLLGVYKLLRVSPTSWAQSPCRRRGGGAAGRLQTDEGAGLRQNPRLPRRWSADALGRPSRCPAGCDEALRLLGAASVHSRNQSSVRRGSTMTKRVMVSSDSVWTVPPCASTIDLTMASPRPAPSPLRCRDGSPR